MNILLNKTLTLIMSLILFVISFFIVKEFIIIIIPFYIGYLISKLFIPIINKLKIKNKYIKSITIFLLILIFISFFTFLFFKLGQSSIKFFSDLVKNSENIQNYIINLYHDLSFKSIDIPIIKIPLNLSTIIEKSINQLFTFISNQSKNIIDFSVKTIGLFPQILMIVIITFISAFFFTKDYSLINKVYKEKVKPTSKHLFENKYFLLIKNKLLYVILGYIKAQAILMSITFTITTIGLFILKIENFLLKAFIISFLDALPIFGTAIILIPWVIYQIITKDFFLAIGLFILYSILTITRQSLEPQIFGNQIGLYPLITLFSIYGGLKIIGFWGIFLGPLIAISIKAIIENKDEL
ncbi:MAG: sporulation integral membrane protein YtvI [Bacillota bacterium]